MDFAAWLRKIDEYLLNSEPEMLALLQDLVSIDSDTNNAAGVNRVGDRIEAELKDFMTFRLAKQAVPEDEAWQNDLADARMARSHDRSCGPGIAIIGHMDTVFPAGEAARRPFHLDREKDIATGPGVADMKAGLTAMIFAARALKKSGLMPCPLTLMFSADEELGSPTSSRHLLKELPGAYAVICAEPGAPGDIVTVSRKGSGHMRLKAFGKAAHAGRNYEDGASAILEIAHKILEIDKLLDLSIGRTVNTGILKGGISANSIAPYAEATIHLTYRTLADGKYVVQKIREIAARPCIPGVHCTVSGGLRLYPFERSNGGDALFELVKNAGNALGMNIRGCHYESAAESGFCSSALGIPTICCMGPEGDNIHTVKEYLRPSTLLPRTRLIALTALAAAYKFGKF